MYSAVRLKKLNVFCLIPLLLNSFIAQAAPDDTTTGDLILTGKIKATDNQTFYSPKTNSWQVQIQWMVPEGDIVEEGELVVVFDSGNIQTEIEQNEVNLITEQEELHRKKASGEQKLLETTYALKRTELLLERARIDADISLVHLSEYDYQKYQLELEKAILAHAKAKESLTQINVANKVELTKQNLKIENIEYQLKYKKQKLDKMSLYAERSGPVLYGSHPWTGKKIFVGMTAQPSWEIAEIPAMKGLYIEAWVHEVDYKYVKLGLTSLISFDAFPNEKFTAQLYDLSTQPEERKEWGNDVYYRSLFKFEKNEDLTLLPGMSVQLELNGESHE